MKSLNIAYGKFAKSILFDKDKWGAIGGDAAPSLLIIRYAQMNPQHKIYLIGKSDLTQFKNKLKKENRLEELNNIPSNIIDIYENKNKESSNMEWCLKATENIKFDVGLFFAGPDGTVNIPNFTKKKSNKEEYAKPLVIQYNYAAPIIAFLNKTNIPWFGISEDPRYIPANHQDLSNVEKFELSQFNKIVNHKVCIDRENRILQEFPVKYNYSKTELLFALGEKKNNLKNIDPSSKTNHFMMLLHGNEKRFEIIKKWFIDNNIDVKIFGIWKEYEKQYPNIFKNVQMSKMLEEVYKTKYTLILGRRYPEFVTSKFWESIHYGIIPFIHKDYDSEHYLPIPEILRINNAEEMIKMMKIIDNDDELYKSILSYFDDVLKEEYYNGVYFNNLINDSINKCIGD